MSKVKQITWPQFLAGLEATPNSAKKYGRDYDDAIAGLGHAVAAAYGVEGRVRLGWTGDVAFYIDLHPAGATRYTNSNTSWHYTPRYGYAEGVGKHGFHRKLAPDQLPSPAREIVASIRAFWTAENQIKFEKRRVIKPVSLSGDGKLLLFAGGTSAKWAWGITDADRAKYPNRKLSAEEARWLKEIGVIGNESHSFPNGSNYRREYLSDFNLAFKNPLEGRVFGDGWGHSGINARTWYIDFPSTAKACVEWSHASGKSGASYGAHFNTKDDLLWALA